MKKTLNINLGGYPFTIDEDAYNLLKDYLDTIRYAFDTTEDTEDLASDIEARIAEILIEKENGGVRIISLDEISKVIERIGEPSQFIDPRDMCPNTDEVIIEETKDQQFKNAETINPPPYNPDHPQQPLRKKLFRDPQNSMLGGVCSGLAIYLNLDPTIVRLITVALFFLSASAVAIAYIILWIVVPEARTPWQKMQMRGEDTTVENIGRNITENYREDAAENHSGNNQRTGFFKFIYNCCSIFVKFLIILGLFIAIPVVLALVLVLVACIVALCTGFADGNIYSQFFGIAGYGKMIFHLLLAVLGAIITIGIPLWLFFTRRRRKYDISTTLNNRRSLVLIWLAGIALVSVFTPKTARDIQQLDAVKYHLDISFLEKKKKVMKDLDLKESDIEHMTVDESGITFKDNKGRTIIIDKSGISIQQNPKSNLKEIESSK